MSRSSNKRIGITLGDPAGIGPEVTAKALAQNSIRRLPHLTIIGDWPVFCRHYPKSLPTNITFIDTHSLKNHPVKPGVSARREGQASLDYLNEAVGLLKKKQISALVTGPVCKESIKRCTKPFVGHTEYLAQQFGTKKVGMMFVSPRLKTIIVTRHTPLLRVAQELTTSKIFDCIILSHRALKRLFHLKDPRIALCGLNPHAGEGGTIGQEEITKIIPAIRKARKQHIAVFGPFAADTLFTESVSRKYDLIIAMYHDQGLIPVKAKYFSSLVNLTIGLPFIRTSPAHGTAFDIAGKNRADPASMIEAIKLAARLA